MLLLRVDERNEDSFIARDDFFFHYIQNGNNSRSNLFFHGLTLDLFSRTVHFLCQEDGKLHYKTTEERKGHEKRDLI